MADHREAEDAQADAIEMIGTIGRRVPAEDYEGYLEGVIEDVKALLFAAKEAPPCGKSNP
jgi:hypothetical protein